MSSNVAIGRQALCANTTASNNTAVGMLASRKNTTGAQNTAIGAGSLACNTTGVDNTAIGQAAIETNTTGGENVGVGRKALEGNTTGSSNTGIGFNAGCQTTTGGNNTMIGRLAGSATSPFTVTTQNHRIVLGNNDVTNFYAKVSLTATSDARDKMNFETVPHGLDFVNQLKPYKFNFRKSREIEAPHGNAKYGFKAQDVLALEGDNPVIINNENEESLKITDSHLVPVLVNAIKELKAEIDKLKKK